MKLLLLLFFFLGPITSAFGQDTSWRSITFAPGLTVQLPAITSKEDNPEEKIFYGDIAGCKYVVLYGMRDFSGHDSSLRRFMMNMIQAGMLDQMDMASVAYVAVDTSMMGFSGRWMRSVPPAIPGQILSYSTLLNGHLFLMGVYCKRPLNARDASMRRRFFASAVLP